MFHLLKMFFSYTGAFLFMILSVLPFSQQFVKPDFCELENYSCLELPSGTYEVERRCTNKTQVLKLQTWLFFYPDISGLTVSNCSNLILSLESLRTEDLSLEMLKISNVANLTIETTSSYFLPRNIIFENIGIIDTIQRGIFNNQEEPASIIEYVTFRNLTIGIIDSLAFFLNHTIEFKFEDVHVYEVKENAITMGHGVWFSIQNSKIEKLGHFSMNVDSFDISITGNRFSEISSNGINGTSKAFNFEENSVGIMHLNSFSIRSKHVNIVRNKFSRLEVDAFNKILPMKYPEESLMGDAPPEFIYTFKENLIESSEIGGITPDLTDYKEETSRYDVTNNILSCTCQEWISANKSLVGQFYDDLKNFANKNKCSFTNCEVALGNMQRIVDDGKCDESGICEIAKDYIDPTTGGGVRYGENYGQIRAIISLSVTYIYLYLTR